MWLTTLGQNLNFITHLNDNANWKYVTHNIGFQKVINK